MDYTKLSSKELLEKIEKQEIGNGIITLLGINSPRAKAIVMPTQNPLSKEWYGVFNGSEEDKKKEKFYLEKDSSIELYHGIEFDLNEAVSKAYWEMVKHNELVSFSMEEVQSTPNAMFYIEMPSVEDSKEVSTEKLVHEAIGYILNDTEENLRYRATLLGIENPESFKFDSLKNLVIKMAKKKSQKVINVYKGDVISISLLLSKCLQKGIIKNEGGLYKYGIQPMGATEEATLAYLNHKDNKGLVQTIKEHYDNVTGESLFTKKQENVKVKDDFDEEYPDNLVELTKIAEGLGITKKFSSKKKTIEAIKEARKKVED